VKKIFLTVFLFILSFSSNADLQDIFGNSAAGDYCKSDFECASLCCNQKTNTCNDHDTTSSPLVLCNKAVGELCVANEFCKRELISFCKIVKTSVINGVQTCSLVCKAVEAEGQCINRLCHLPAMPTMPTYDPNDCSNAVDP
jgi:hypothetical protein